MELFTIFLILHIAGGVVGLICGTINIIRTKGDKFHRTVGKLFLAGMLTVGLTSFVLSVLHPNYFLFMVGVFTIYMVSTGERYIAHKGIAIGQQVQLIDWALTVLMLLFGIAFISFGIYKIIQGEHFSVVFIVFGFIALRMVRADIRNYRGRSGYKNNWLVMHIQRMIGGYIAALTAFLVVNNKILPAYVAFLLPTVIFVPLIITWTKKYRIENKSIS